MGTHPYQWSRRFARRALEFRPLQDYHTDMAVVLCKPSPHKTGPADPTRDDLPTENFSGVRRPAPPSVCQTKEYAHAT